VRALVDRKQPPGVRELAAITKINAGLVGSEATGTAAGFKAWIDFARGRTQEPRKNAKRRRP
jgi:hypothetical protein